jgi:hypothetical protein
VNSCNVAVDSGRICKEEMSGPESEGPALVCGLLVIGTERVGRIKNELIDCKVARAGLAVGYEVVIQLRR